MEIWVNKPWPASLNPKKARGKSHQTEVKLKKSKEAEYNSVAARVYSLRLILSRYFPSVGKMRALPMVAIA